MPLFSKSAYTMVPYSETQSHFASPWHEEQQWRGEEQDVSHYLRTEFSNSTLEGMANQLWRRS